MPLAVVRDILGHSDIKLTARYAHVAPAQKREAVEAIAEHWRSEKITHPPLDRRRRMS